jgi:hypothetical protein
MRPRIAKKPAEAVPVDLVMFSASSRRWVLAGNEAISVSAPVGTEFDISGCVPPQLPQMHKPDKQSYDVKEPYVQ